MLPLPTPVTTEVTLFRKKQSESRDSLTMQAMTFGGGGFPPPAYIYIEHAFVRKDASSIFSIVVALKGIELPPSRG